MNTIGYNELTRKQQETYRFLGINASSALGDPFEVLMSPKGAMVGVNTRSKYYAGDLRSYEQQGYRLVVR